MKEVILKIGAAGEEFDGLNMIKRKIFNWNRLLLIIILLKIIKERHIFNGDYL